MVKLKRDFFLAPNAIFEYRLNPYQLAVYLCLTRYSNNTAAAYPSYNSIAEKCGMSRRKVISTIEELERMGLVKKRIRPMSGGNNQSNLYDTVHPYEALGGGAQHAPPSAQHAPPSAHGAPYKELQYKELQDKENNNTSISKENEENPETHVMVKKKYMAFPVNDHPFLFLYDKYFFSMFNKHHMRITPEQYEHILRLLSLIEGYGNNIEDWNKAVYEHFSDLPERNNGNILAFLKAAFRYFDIDPQRHM